MNMEATTEKALATKEVLSEMAILSRGMHESILEAKDLDEVKEWVAVQNNIMGNLLEICIKQEEEINRLDRVNQEILEKVAIQFDVIVDR